jgi:hypothetical protein
LEEDAKNHQHNISGQESSQKTLEKDKEELEKEMQGKKQEVKEVLQEVYDDSRLNESFPANCTVCGKTVNITYGKFYEMVSRYNIGSSRHESYKEEPVYEYRNNSSRGIMGYVMQATNCTTATAYLPVRVGGSEKVKVQTGTAQIRF